MGDSQDQSQRGLAGQSLEASLRRERAYPALGITLYLILHQDFLALMAELNSLPVYLGNRGRTGLASSGLGTLGPFPAILSLTVCTSLLSLGNVGLPRGTGARCEVHLLGHIPDCLDMDMDENNEAEFI